MAQAQSSPPLVCVPNAIPTAERANHFALARRLFSEVAQERTELPDGYAFRFLQDDLQAVGKFVDNERKCCPFMSFVIELAHQPGPLWLRMTGPEGTREILDAELSLGKACQCN